MAQNDANQGKLYTRFVSTLKLIQYFGYFVVAVFYVLLANSYFQNSAAQGGVQPLAVLLNIILPAVITVIFIYVITQSLIAVVDLLSRIERNTRVETVQNIQVDTSGLKLEDQE